MYFSCTFQQGGIYPHTRIDVQEKLVYQFSPGNSASKKLAEIDLVYRKHGIASYPISYSIPTKDKL